MIPDRPIISASAPFCPACGYDLTGLDMPRACPECGRLADPARDSDAAQRWFTESRSELEWLVRPSTVPAALYYASSGPSLIPAARRRQFRWLWLPAILTAFAVVAGTCIVVEYDVKTWHYNTADPERTPVQVSETIERDRLYSFSGFYRGGDARLVLPTGEALIEYKERSRVRAVLDLPDSFHQLSFNIMWLVIPWLGLLCGYLPARLIVRWHGRRFAKTYGQTSAAHPGMVCSSLMAAPLGVSIWAWLGVTIAFGVRTACLEDAGEPGSLDCWLEWPLGVVFCLWCLVGGIGWPILVTRDGARRLFPHRTLTCILLVAITICVPVGVAIAVF